MKRIQEDNRLRRALFVYSVTAFCLVSVNAAVYILPDHHSLGERLVESFVGLIEWLCSIYLGVSLLDRSGIAASLASRFSTRQQKETPP